MFVPQQAGNDFGWLGANTKHEGVGWRKELFKIIWHFPTPVNQRF
jgi:hypothetical protein